MPSYLLVNTILLHQQLVVKARKKKKPNRIERFINLAGKFVVEPLSHKITNANNHFSVSRGVLPNNGQANEWLGGSTEGLGCCFPSSSGFEQNTKTMKWV